LATILLAVVTLNLPPGWGPAVAEFIGLPPQPKAAAMRELMALIAGATIGTGAVAFSVIVAASVTAAGQYGPRLLTNFLADRGTQVTLGIFVSAFLYAIIVHATIRDDGPDHGLAGMVAMAFAFASVGALIYFLHHAPSALRINQAISSIGETLLANAATRFPASCGYPVEDTALDAASARYEGLDSGRPLLARTTGTVSIIDGEIMAKVAARCGTIVSLRIAPGVFQTVGQPVADLHGGEVDDDDEEALLDTIATAKLRTPSQDIEFLANELTEIAMRALSPGINDPYTAIACMEWLGAALAEIARADDPSPYRCTEDGDFRLYAKPLSLEAYLTETLGRIRQVSARNVRAAEGHLRSLAMVALGAGDQPDAMAAVRAEARALVALAEIALSGPDLDAVRGTARRFDAALAAEPPALDKFR
ncbi:MAG: DUF2254 domain-containing protein, partial [Pseudomonadota bacterium]